MIIYPVQYENQAPEGSGSLDETSVLLIPFYYKSTAFWGREDIFWGGGGSLLVIISSLALLKINLVL